MTQAGLTRRRRGSSAWVPKQHGAWAMLIVPSVVGGVLGVRAGTTGVAASVSLGLAAIAGYLCFSAAGLWLKVPAVRRAPFQTAALVYLGVTAVLGLVSTLLVGLALMVWVPVLAGLSGAGLLLVKQRRERSVLSGGVTVAAGCLLVALVAAPNPAHLALVPGALLATAACFGYFFGTVLYVKTIIRERGRRGWWWASVGYHAALAAAAAGACRLDLPLQLPALAGFFALALARAVVVPQVALRRTVRPRAVGILEIVLSLLLMTTLIR